MSVLILDDHLDFGKLVTLILKREGIESTYYANGARALSELDETLKKPSLIILDILMPVMNGMEFLNKLKLHRSYSNIPIILISSYQNSKLVQETLKHEVKAFFAKPIDCEELVNKVKIFMLA